MLQITRHVEPGRGEALAVGGEPFAWLPAELARMTPAQIAHVYTTWYEGGGEALTPEAVIACLAARGLIVLH